MAEIKDKLKEAQEKQTQMAQELQKGRQMLARLEDELLVQVGKVKALEELLPKEEKKDGAKQS